MDGGEGSMMRTGFYPGSFDPITYGHLDIIARAARIVDKLVIGVGTHGAKQALLSGPERVALIEQVIKPIVEHAGVKISVITFDGLTVDAARKAHAGIVIRGLRDASDFDYEVQMSQMNGALSPDMETVFLAASPATRMIASSLVKQIAKMGGDTSLFLPKESEVAIRNKLSNSNLIEVKTSEIFDMHKLDIAGSDKGLSGIALEHYQTGKSFDGSFSAAEFKAKYLQLFPDRAPGSILPSDYADNNDQLARAKFPHFLTKNDRDSYRFIDFNKL